MVNVNILVVIGISGARNLSGTHTLSCVSGAIQIRVCEQVVASVSANSNIHAILLEHADIGHATQASPIYVTTPVMTKSDQNIISGHALNVFVRAQMKGRVEVPVSVKTDKYFELIFRNGCNM